VLQATTIRSLAPDVIPDGENARDLVAATSLGIDDRGEIEGEHGGEINWDDDDVPVSRAMCCTEPEIVWAEEMEKGGTGEEWVEVGG